MAGAIVLLIGGILLLGFIFIDELLPRRPGTRRQMASNLQSLLEDLSWGSYIALGLAIVIAVAMLDVPALAGSEAQEVQDEDEERAFLGGLIVSVSVLMLGILAAYYVAERSRRQQETSVDEEILKLIESFRGIYRVSPAIFSGLEEARLKVKDPLRSDVTAAVEAFRATSSSNRAYAVLRRRTDNPYMSQFVYILESTDIAPRQAVLDAMGDLIDRLRRHLAIRDETAVELTGITLQTRFTLLVSVVIIVVVALIPFLRRAYTGSLRGQLVFTAATAISAYSAYRIDQRVLALKEKVI